jgi:hypothetical protein
MDSDLRKNITLNVYVRLFSLPAIPTVPQLHLRVPHGVQRRVAHARAQVVLHVQRVLGDDVAADESLGEHARKELAVEAHQHRERHLGQHAATLPGDAVDVLGGKYECGRKLIILCLFILYYIIIIVCS